MRALAEEPMRKAEASVPVSNDRVARRVAQSSGNGNGRTTTHPRLDQELLEPHQFVHGPWFPKFPALSVLGSSKTEGDTQPWIVEPAERADERPPASLRRYLRWKRVLDVILTSLLCLLLLPVFLLISLVIFLEDRGPILFWQMRVGKDGQTFRFYKFRSMVRNAEAIKAELVAHNEADGPIFKIKDDPRVTRVGRFLRRYSIDELPQLFSVLRGEMSLVGPRPHLPSEVALYTERQKKRLSVQPGLLCLREVCGRSLLTFERWIEMDMFYIEYRSLGTDLRILLCSLPAVLKGDGAY